MTTIQRPNSRPVAATLLAVFVLGAAISAVTQSISPTDSLAAGLYQYKSESQWYNGPVGKPVLAGNNMAFVSMWESAGQYLYTTDLASRKDEKVTNYPIASNTEIAASSDFIVWSNGYKNKWNVFLFDRHMHATQVIVDSQNELGRPSIEGTGVVWREANYDLGGAMIRYYNHTGAQTKTLVAGKYYTNPVISGSRVAWFETATGCGNDAYRLCNPDAGVKSLVVYNLDTNTQQVVAENISTVYAPAISSSRVVWSAKSGGQYDLYQYDFGTGLTTRLTNNSINETYPVLANGRVGYLGMSADGSTRIAHVFDIASRNDVAMPYNGSNHGWVTISENKFAWVQHGTDSRVFVYDFSISGVMLDIDNDGISQDSEQHIGTDPQKKDTDGDGISDMEEVSMYKTNPTTVDSDGDGLTDYREIYLYKTNAVKFDTDGDGYHDGLEIKTNHNPLSKSTKKVDPSVYVWIVPAR